MDPEIQDPQGGSPDPVADPTVAPGTPQAIDWESDDNPYKSRFENYRREGDQRATRLSQYEQSLADLSSDDPQRQRAAAEALGIELVYDDEPEYDDPVERLRAELDALKGQFSRSDEQRRRDLVAQTVEGELAKLDLDEADKDWVLSRAVSLPPKGDLPDIAAAHRMLVERDKAAMQRWAASKKAPGSIQPGTTATRQRDVTEMLDSSGGLTPEGLAYYAQRLEDASAL